MSVRTKVSFTGDVMIEHTRLASFQKNEQYDFTSLFAQCKDLFYQSDYVVANLETPVAGEELRYSFKHYNFNTPESILVAMKDVGIKMVTTANNHVLDRGIQGIDKTIETIEKYQLDYTGTSKTGILSHPLIKVINGIRIGFLSYTYGTEACYNMYYLNRNEQYRVNLLRNQELYSPFQRFVVKSESIVAKCLRGGIRLVYPSFFKKGVEEYPQNEKRHKKHILSDIAYCKEKKCDMIVMCMHSGGQFNSGPTDYTKHISEFCKNSGVDVIIGNHEHRIQYFNAKKEIAYCLGNFTSNYGIERKPFNKNAECSILLHMYIDENLCRKFTFSILMSKMNDKGQIITVPLYDEYMSNKDEEKRNYLLAANTKAYNDFCLTMFECIEPQIEYECIYEV